MLLGFALFIPFCGAFLIVAVRHHPYLQKVVVLVTSGALFTTVVMLYRSFQAGNIPQLEIVEIMAGLSIHFTIEPLGMVFSLVASFLWIITSIYSMGYLCAYKAAHQTRFYCCFALALAATIGLAFSANLLTLFICYEILTLVTYPLVTHNGDEHAKQGGRVYLGYLLGTSIGLQLLAIIWTWQVAGTLEFTDGGILAGQTDSGFLAILLALYVFGIGKAAVMPMHRWLPAAMVAPVPVSALLHAVAVVKAGVFTVLKVVVYIFGIERLTILEINQWLVYVATISILLASLIAIYQDNLKLRLAYSTVSQLAYIVLGAMLANATGILGGAMHIATHAFGKITLFFCAGAILLGSGKTKISEMRGLGKKMPLTMLAFLIGSMSIVGLPPMGGVWSKWFLITATLEAEYLIPFVVLLVSTLLNAAYLLVVPIRGFFCEAIDDDDVCEAPPLCLIALAITCCGCVALFFYPYPLYELLAPWLGR